MRALTDFGDLAVLLPLSAVILAWLLTYDSRRVVGSWAISAGLCAVITAFLKVYLYACPPAPDLVSPSGHSSLSVLVYGTITLLVAAEQRDGLRPVIHVAGASFIVAIAGSRLWLNAHSLPEIAIGIVIGAATLTLFASRYFRSRSEVKRLWPLILSAIAVIAILHGQELRVEAFLHATSRHFHLASVACIG